jgi:hypothetical protein
MRASLEQALRQLRLSGLLSSLEVRLERRPGVGWITASSWR